MPLVTMLCAFFGAPLQAQGQSVEAYVQMSADKTTLTFYYDTKRASREGTTWGIEETQTEREGQYSRIYPAWTGTYNNPDTTTTKAVVDASFANFQPTSTAYWFQDFKKLTAIEGFQYLNTEKVTKMGFMFCGCISLNSLALSNFNTSEVTTMSHMFFDCESLTTLDLKNFNTSKVKDMERMFANCFALTSLDLMNFNTEKVENMSAMFGSCFALKNLDLKSFNTEKVTNMADMFGGCSALTSLDLKNFYTENVENMRLMFSGCSSLTSLDLKNINTQKVWNMNEMFKNCSNLASIVCNKTWKCKKSQDMFNGCTALRGAVAYDESKTDVTMANPETGYFTKKIEDKPEVTTPEAYVQMSADNTTLTFFYDTKRATREGTTWGIEEKKEDNEEQIPAWSSTYNNPNTTTTKAVVDASFKDFRPTSTASWFEGFRVLTTIEGLQYLNTSEVTDMGGMFAGCAALTVLNLKNFNTSKVTDMGAMFSDCTALTAINLKSFNTSKVTNMSGMFSDCTALTALDFTTFNTSNVTNMSFMFADCSALTALDLKNINTEKVEDMNNMFQNCSKLSNIISNRTWNCEESQEMFKGCTVLKGAVAYDESKVDVTMANPETGYFTKKVEDKPEVTTPEAYVQMSADKTTLSFFYDTKRASREGTTWGIEETQAESVGQYSRIYPAWSGTYKKPNTTTTKAVVDASFANFRPTKTARWLLLLGSLTDIEGLQYLNTSNVTDMSEMFAGCSRLTSLDLKSFNTEKVTNMAGMFWLCRGLTTLNLKSFNTEKVTEMGFMFYVCRSLTTLDFSNFNTSNVTNMREMFWDCSGLTSLDLSNFNTEKVVSMEEMFKGCSKLTSIVSNKAWNCEESQEMFKGCTALKGAVPYDESKVDVTMANPETGYFTKKVEDKPEVTTPEAYVQMSADKTTLTFFYDTKRATRKDTTWGINEKQQVDERVEPAWTGTWKNPNTTTTNIVIDASFANFRPTETNRWFQRNLVLTKIEGLENLNTSEVKDMSDMFTFCQALTTLDLSSFNTEKVTNMTGMFSNCTLLTSINLSTFKTEKVRAMDYMFCNCPALTTLDLKNFNTSNVEDMGYMFYGCSDLTSLDLKSFNTQNVWNMREMFKGCSALTSLNLSNFNTEKVVSMEEMFKGCSALSSLDLSSFNTSEVTNMRKMFENCSQLASIVSNKAWNCEKSQEMFKGCTALKGAVKYDASKLDVTMANPETGYFTKKVQDKPEVTSPEAYVQMSADKTTLTFFYDTKRATREGTTWGINEKQQVGERVEPAWTGTYENPDTTTTKAVMDASFKDFRPTSTASWFKRFKALTAIEGLQNLNTSEVTNMSDIFYNCSALTSLDLKNFNTERVTNMSGMFAFCSTLTSLDLKNFNTSNVTEMNWMFTDCAALTSLDLTSFNTEKVTDMGWMFAGCKALTSLYLKNFNTQKVWNMSEMFSHCSALTSLDLSSFNTSNVENIVSMFAGCESLTTLDLSNFNTSNVTDMRTMFWACSGLTTLYLTNFNTSNVKNMGFMFAYCSKLAAIFSNKTWKCEDSQAMFKGCTALKGAVAYDESKVDVTMANPETGYFTKKAQDKPEVTTPEAYVQMSADKKTLTFFYDTKRTSREGTTWGIEEKKENHGFQYPAWVSTDANSDTTTTKAVFDASFKDFQPTSTAFWFEGFRVLTNIEGLQYLNTSNVTNMRGMFTGCSGLTTLDLRSFNTSNVTDMGYMFANCSRLTSLNLKNFNTSNVTDMSVMFLGCSLTSLDLTSFNTEKVTDMSNMFGFCTALTAIDLKNFNTSNVTDMSWMFNNCSALTAIDLKNFNTAQVTNMSGIFAGCSALTSLDLKNFNTEKVKYMVNLFTGCSALTSLDLKNFKTEKVEYTIEMFYNCSALTSLDLTSFNTEKVTNMRKMFENCSQLSSIVSNKTWNCEESQDMFKGCTALKGAVAYDESKTDATMANPTTGYFTKEAQDKPEVTTPEAYVQMSADQKTLTFFYDTKRATREGTTWGIEETQTKSVGQYSQIYPAWIGTWEKANTTTMKAVVDASFKGFSPTSTALWFHSFKALTAIEGLQNLNTSEVTDMSGMFLNCSALTTLDLKSFNTEKVTNMSDMFAGCYVLTSLVLSSFNTEKVTNMSDMFAGCSALTSLDLSNFNTEKVTNMRGMFLNCSALTTLDLKSFNTEKVTNMDGMFHSCSALTTLDLKNFNTEKVTNMRGMFNGCSALTSLDLKNFNTSNVTNMSEMFAGCSALTSLDLSIFNTEKVTIMFGMFLGCSSLTSLDLSNFNTSNVTNMRWMFRHCSALTSLDLSNFNTEKVTDMFGMFAACSSLTSLDLSNFNTSEVTNMVGMFYECTGLKALDLKNFNTQKVWNMNELFYGCSALTSLDLSNFNTERVTHMRAMFAGCSGLKSLDLSHFNTSNVTDMRWMFRNCSALTSLDLSNFNTEKVTDMSEMFLNCSQLVNIVSNKAWNCEQSEDMFFGCTALKGAVAYDESKTDVTMANSETGYFTKKAKDKPEVTTPEAYVQMSADKTTLTFFYDTKRASREGTTWDITSPIATRSASLLHAKAWGASEEKPNSTTTKVVFDASFAKFYPKTTAEWFAHYAALKRIEGIENLNTSEVTSMKGMFTGCAALDTLDLTTFNTEKVNDMSEMFKNCANLSTVVCDKVWSTPHSEQMFYGCVKLLGKAAFDAQKTSVEMANPNSGYFVATKPTALLPMLAPARANGIYTLQGKRVSTDRQHLPAGVYIVNGKKVVVQ